MMKYGLALVGAASLALAGCGGGTDDNLNNLDAYNTTDNLDALSNQAASDAEAEALGNQQEQLQNESNAATDELNASGTTEAEENVSGM